MQRVWAAAGFPGGTWQIRTLFESCESLHVDTSTGPELGTLPDSDPGDEGTSGETAGPTGIKGGGVSSWQLAHPLVSAFGLDGSDDGAEDGSDADPGLRITATF